MHRLPMYCFTGIHAHITLGYAHDPYAEHVANRMAAALALLPKGCYFPMEVHINHEVLPVVDVPKAKPYILGEFTESSVLR